MASNMGSLGNSSTAWLTGMFGKCLEEKPSLKQPTVDVIYPSFRNVKNSLDGMLGGACLPYSSSTHSKQTWLQSHFSQWKSESRHRSRAVPHIKTYTKISPDGKSLAWFVLTSANLSKAAWGMPLKNSSAKILSYELGVLFLPKFLIQKNIFSVKQHGKFEPKESFPLPYDAPITPYAPEDKVFQYDKCFS